MKFWEQLLSRAKEKGITLHAGRAPTKQMWISAGTGKAGLSFNYVIWLEEKTAVELYVDTGDKEQNKRIYDLFYSMKENIDSDFGTPLSWERLDDRRASRIRFFIEKGGLRDDETNWPFIQDAMIDAMDRLSKAFTRHIQALRE